MWAPTQCAGHMSKRVKQAVPRSPFFPTSTLFPSAGAVRMRVGKKTTRWSSNSKVVEEPHLLLHVLESSGGGDGSIVPQQDCEMDGRIWQGLPQDIVDKVLLVLPPAVQFQFRAVCKRWLALLSSPRFLRESASASPLLGPSFICAFEYRPGRLEESGGKYSKHAAKPVLPPNSGFRVHKLPLTFLPVEFQCWGYRSVVAQDGLICVKMCKSKEVSAGGGEGSNSRQQTLDSMCVLNPITRLWKVLPLLDTQNQRYQLMKVQANKCGGGFKVILVCGDYYGGNLHMPWTVAVYSSESDAWRTFQGHPGPSVQSTRDVFSSPLIYHCANRHMVVDEVEDARLVRHADLVLYGRDYFKHQLIGHGEDVFNVGEVSQQQQQNATTSTNAGACFGIWKLERGATVWHLVSKTPAALLACLVQPVFERATAGHGQSQGQAKLSFGGARVAGGIIFLIIHKVHYRRPTLRSRLGMQKPRRDFMQDGKEAIMCSDVLAYHLVKRTWQVCFKNVARWITGDFYDALGVLDLRLNDYH